MAKTKSAKTSYWQELFGDYASSTNLWLENYDIPVRIKNENSASFLIEKKQVNIALNKNLNNLSKKINISIENIILGAWGLLLNKFSGTDTIAFGYGSTSGMTKKNLSILSPLLPIRSNINENETIQSYLQGLTHQLSQSLKHIKSIPNEEKSKNIYHYLILMTDKKNKKTQFPLSLDRYPLILIVKSTKNIQFELIYNKCKFTKNSVVNILKHLMVILECFTIDSGQSPAYISILTGEEKKLLLPRSDKSKKKIKSIYPDVCVHELLYKQAEKNPDKLAVQYQNTFLTYRQLNELSNQLANVLLKKGIKPGDTVAVFLERTPAIIIAMFAAFKIGAIYVPISPKYPDDRIQFILTDSNAEIILVNNTDRMRKEFVSKSLIFNDDFGLLKNESSKNIKNIISPQQVAYAIYTSGTTGQPKGVLIRHTSLVNLAEWYVSCFSITHKDRVSQFATQGFDTFFCETIPTFACGASLHMIDENSKLTPTLFLPWLEKEKITICDLPTAYAQVLFTLNFPKNLCLRLLKVGGESLTHYPQKTIPFDLWNIYGPTETTVEATYVKVVEANVAPEKQKMKHMPPPIGVPIQNSEMYVVDKHHQLVPFGVVGELLIGGRCVSVGYLNRPQLTREKFIRNMFNDDSNDHLYRTGDLVRWLSDGNLEFIGRIDHQVKIRGYRIELSEIETTISQYPDVREVVVLAKDDVSGQKNLIAYLVADLNKLRIPYQERCLVTFDEIKFIDLITEDLSKEGVAVSGLADDLQLGQKLRINLKLPGLSDAMWLEAIAIWQDGHRAGFKFSDTGRQKEFLEKSIEYYLSTHNLMQTLQSASTKRNLRRALKKKLPEYMVPTAFSYLTEFPLTFNGKVDLKALPLPQDFDRLLERKYVEARNQTEKKLVKMWNELLNQKQISITDNFFDLGGNSLLVSKLSVMITQEFDISVPAKVFFDLPFIPILAEYIDSKGEKYTFNSAVQEEIRHDAILSDNIHPLLHKNKFIQKPRGILLTGAGGFLGIYLLRELLKSTDAKIYCLIRKGGFESAAKRLIENIEHYGLSQEVSLSNRRIVIIASDIGLDRFGIPEEQYNNMAENVDMIFHCGAQVNTMAAYTALRNSNVQGTIEIIKFATYKINKAIHYISTLSAAYMMDEKHCFAEEFPDANPEQLSGGYAVSKWVSERLLTQLKSVNLPVCIYRSGYILGQSDTGITNTNDALLLLIKGCIQLGYAPSWKEKITLLPVDFVSKAIVEIGLHANDESDVFHVDHHQGMLWTDLVAWLNDYGYKIKLCNHEKWLELLTTITDKNALFPFLPHYLAQKTEPHTPDTAMDKSLNNLKSLGIEYPKIDDALLRRYMNYLCGIGFMPKI